MVRMVATVEWVLVRRVTASVAIVSIAIVSMARLEEVTHRAEEGEVEEGRQRHRLTC